MEESENIDKVVRALAKVPEKRLMIIELANKVPITNGEMDTAYLADHQPEINLAIAEAKAYGAHTIQAVEALVGLMTSKEV